MLTIYVLFLDAFSLGIDNRHASNPAVAERAKRRVVSRIRIAHKIYSLTCLDRTANCQLLVVRPSSCGGIWGVRRQDTLGMSRSLRLLPSSSMGLGKDRIVSATPDRRALCKRKAPASGPA